MNETIILIVIKILLLAWYISSFQPIQWLLELIPYKLLKLILIAITGCFKCSTFFTGLILSQDIWISLGASVISSLLQVAKNKLKI